jgi:hypothetical protein
MSTFAGILLVTGLYPLSRAWQANRQTTLRQTLAWTAAAWAAWVFAPWAEANEPLALYLALSLTGCAGVAVLGARRPGVGAWNFVVAGLLAVLLLPVAEGFGTLAVILLNYLPTRLGPAAALLGAGCAGGIARLAGEHSSATSALAGRIAVSLTPWLALVCVRRPRKPREEVDRIWLAFRDRFGFVWGQRLREQFNRAAANAGWAVSLTWTGLRPTGQGTSPDPAAVLAALQAVLKRFGPADEDGNPQRRDDMASRVPSGAE